MERMVKRFGHEVMVQVARPRLTPPLTPGLTSALTLTLTPT